MPAPAWPTGTLSSLLSILSMGFGKIRNASDDPEPLAATFILSSRQFHLNLMHHGGHFAQTDVNRDVLR